MTLGIRDWLALDALPGLGPARLAPLMRRWREEDDLHWPQGWLAALPANLAQPLRLWLEHPARSPLTASVDAAIAWEAEDPRHHLLHPGHPAWPDLLDQLPDPPSVIWAKGDLEVLARPAMAIVGTRRPTREGQDNAMRFARDLVERGYCIVSGMALGIDGAAQRAALQAGGATIGVLGCGVDVIYPPRHASLYRELLAGQGLLLSEHPPDTRAHPRFFPRRNRLITGLAQGVLVVEAAEKSGSLVSARLALEQDREVFAIPGSIHNPQSTGCLRLIRQGEAALVRDVDDMLADLAPWQLPVSATTTGREEDQRIAGDRSQPSTASRSAPNVAPVAPDSPLLAALTDAPTPVDLLVELTGQSVAELQLGLLELELDGWVAQTTGGWVRRGR
ncbi:DNA protecting protein DprA [Salinicola sp. MH3R3-1]|uniref:DNA-processing protein DprA n=1 Tax=Salinicola sp. MH3R3-1 TaxID=1928762 RepID=UPI00094E49DF|nr:DNA-processing protein DprA [Salinicola sp. MH3R3-1]OLO07387.1 DNA protecting protein DprA [Salinicola sp. MH3R3-1]